MATANGLRGEREGEAPSEPQNHHADHFAIIATSLRADKITRSTNQLQRLGGSLARPTAYLALGAFNSLKY